MSFGGSLATLTPIPGNLRNNCAQALFSEVIEAIFPFAFEGPSSFSQKRQTLEKHKQTSNALFKYFAES